MAKDNKLSEDRAGRQSRRIPVVIMLSPKARRTLQAMTLIEKGPTHLQESRLMERALMIYAAHFETYLAQVAEAAKAGRDPVAFGKRLKPDFIFREEQ